MKIDRLLGILTILMQKEQVTAPHLAKKFEVSRRTIARDIDSLCAAGIPIVTLQGNGGGISIAEGFSLDKNVLTSNELINLIAALKGIGTVSEPSKIEPVLDKLGARSKSVVSLHEPILIDLASHYKNQLTEKIELIKSAILNRQCISFDYYYNKGESTRIINPYLVIFQCYSWYVFGFCLKRQDWRQFKLTRLWELVLLDEYFDPQEVPMKKDFNYSFSEDIQLKAIFDFSEKYQLIETFGLNCFIEKPEGLYFEFTFENRSYLISWLLGFGDKVKVIEPKYIVEEIKDIADKISNRYI